MSPWGKTMNLLLAVAAVGYAEGGDAVLNCAVGDGVPQPPADWIGWKYTWQDDRFNHWLSCASYGICVA